MSIFSTLARAGKAAAKTAAPIVVPLIVNAAAGALQKQGDKLVSRATKPK